jgi:ElaB/YqjD/DUF883 family membrane-anchored ribosome-binding protein
MEELTMRAEVIEKITDVSAKATQLGAEVMRVKESVVDVVDDGITAAKRAVRKGRRAAEDFVDDAGHKVKQHPVKALGVSLGIGLGVGALIGALMGRNGHRRR